MPRPEFRRILLKLSGEMLKGQNRDGVFDIALCKKLAAKIKEVTDSGVQVALVIGGGNIFRGGVAEELGIERVRADHVGMMATVMNAMVMEMALEKQGVEAEALSAVAIGNVVQAYSHKRAVENMRKGRVVIFCYGTGNPYFTTDTAAALRAVEIGADALLKGTKVKGVYSADPKKDPQAQFFPEIGFKDILARGLKVMDQTAFALCSENNLPIVVFDLGDLDNILRIVKGEPVGTLVS